MVMTAETQLGRGKALALPISFALGGGPLRAALGWFC